MRIKLSRFMDGLTRTAGLTTTFLVFWLIIVMWMVSGPLFHWSDTWQLLINTPTTIVSTALGFAILHTQNRDTKALHAKLDAIIEKLDDAIEDPDLRKFIRLEEAPEEQIQKTRNKET